MAELPSGTVTFFFSDVEGSTRLLQQLRDAYGEVLADHRRILRGAFAEHNGQEIDTQGDAFFVAFRKARDAVLAAAACQRGLAAHAWPDATALRVRIGLHTSEPSLGDEGYHGLGVHRGARIMAAGHGGQILVSQATHSVLEDDELPGIAFRELGEFRLKDLERPERIYQVDVDGLPVDFPPPRTADAPTAYTGHEDQLAKAARSVVWRTRLRTRRWLAAGVAAALIAALGVAALLATLGSGTAHALSAVDSNAVGLIDANTGRITGEVTAGATPSHVAVGEAAAWVTNADGNSVSRIDPATKQVVDTIGVGSQPSGIAIGNGYVWVANSLDGTVTQIDAGSNDVVQTIPVGNGPVGVAFHAGHVWVANTGDRTITRIDADNGNTKTLPIAATELAADKHGLWATEESGDRVVKIDPRSGKVDQSISVGNGPTGIAVADGKVWVANSLDGTVSQINPVTEAVTSVSVGNGVTSLAAGAGGVWVSSQFGGTLSRIDPRTNEVVSRIEVGNRPQGVGILGTDVLVGVRQSGAGHRGGTLVVRLGRPTGSLDTAHAYDSTSWAILRMVGDGLVALNQASGLAGTQLVPDLATSLPAPTDGGRTYTFHLRPNIRYSNGDPVRASDVRRALERDFSLELPVPYYYDRIVGAARCEKTPKHCRLPGIEVNDPAGTVAFHLTSPDPEFLYKLALPFAYVVPRGAPAHDAGTHPLAGTGPYAFASVRPKTRITLVRNRYFHEWSKAAQPGGYPDRIDMHVGGTPDQAVHAVIAGQADLFSTAQSETPPTARTLSALMTGHATQVHTNPQPTTISLFLNTRLAPFDRLDVRKALNYAVDRRGAVEAVGGPDVAQPTCQILPPSYPGYRRFCPYTAAASGSGVWTAPDMAKARALVARSGTRGMKVTFWAWPDLGGIGSLGVKLLRSLGYRAVMKAGPSADGYFGAVGDSRNQAQIGVTEWISDYPAASGFFEPVLTCGSFLPGTPNNANDAQFCDHAIDRKIEQGITDQATDPDAARGVWERVDRETVDQAPWVPLVNPRVVDVLSKRAGDYQYSPAGLGVLIDQLWVR